MKWNKTTPKTSAVSIDDTIEMFKCVLEEDRDMEEELKKAKKDRVFITHSGCDKEIVDEVKNYLKQLDVFDEIYETRAGGVISSHCGPGTLGVLFIAGE